MKKAKGNSPTQISYLYPSALPSFPFESKRLFTFYLHTQTHVLHQVSPMPSLYLLPHFSLHIHLRYSDPTQSFLVYSSAPSVPTLPPLPRIQLKVSHLKGCFLCLYLLPPTLPCGFSILQTGIVVPKLWSRLESCAPPDLGQEGLGRTLESAVTTVRPGGGGVRCRWCQATPRDTETRQATSSPTSDSEGRLVKLLPQLPWDPVPRFTSNSVTLYTSLVFYRRIHSLYSPSPCWSSFRVPCALYIGLTPWAILWWL